MKRIPLLLPLVAMGALVAQGPVPLRTRTATYGPATGFPDPVAVALDVDTLAENGPRLALTGGYEGGFAVIALGLTPTNLEMPQGTLLLVEPQLLLPGVCDAAGTFGVPLELFDAAFVGARLHAQGLFWVPPPTRSVEYFQMTAGLALEFVAGNPQGTLPYDGPPLLATVVAERVGDLAATHEVLAQVTVPSSGYQFRLQSVDVLGTTTVLYAKLIAPNPNEVVIREPQLLRLPVALGTEAAPRIEIQVEQSVRDVAGILVFKLAAVLERDF